MSRSRHGQSATSTIGVHRAGSHVANKLKLKSIELFSGAGGLALGSHLAGFEHCALVERDAPACSTLRRNIERGSVKGVDHWDIVETDVTKVSFEDYQPVDVVFGGPPCQPFSIGGKHLGVTDDRNMIPEFKRAINELMPSAFIMENVKGLNRKRFDSYFEYVKLALKYPTVKRHSREDWVHHLDRLERLESRGSFAGLHYNVISRVLNAADYGIPQRRERLFIVGFRADLEVAWNFPGVTHSRTSLLRSQVCGDYWARHELKMPSGIRTDVSMKEDDCLLPWQTVRDALVGLPDPTVRRSPRRVTNHQFYPGARSYPGHTGSELDLPAKTLKAGDHGVPGGENMLAWADGSVRYLTIREAARIQSFPDSWCFEGTWIQVMRQLGNAVPVKLATVVTASVANALRPNSRPSKISP